MRPDEAMSRHVGTFLLKSDGVYVRNEVRPDNAQTNIAVRPDGARQTIIVYPGTVTAKPIGDSGTIRFAPRDYTMRYRVHGPASPKWVQEGSTDFTLRFPLEPKEVDYLVALCEPELRSGEIVRRRTRKEIGELWNYGEDNGDSVLRKLRERLAEDERFPSDLNGRQDVNALLARVAVDEGFVTVRDLEWADLNGARRRADDGPRFRGVDGDTV